MANFSTGNLAALAAVLGVLVGCGGSGADLPATSPVSGTVLLDGKPLEGAASVSTVKIRLIDQQLASLEATESSS